MNTSRLAARRRIAGLLAVTVGIALLFAPGLALPAAAYYSTDGQTYFTYPLESGASGTPMYVGPAIIIAAKSAPTSPPTEVTPTQFIPTASSGSLTTSQIDFLNKAIKAAQTAQKATGVPTSVTIAQAILESNWGRATIGGNNYFGIKATYAPGPAGVVTVPTREFLNGVWVTVDAPFRAYHSMAESFADHAQFLVQNSHFKSAMQYTSNPQLFAVMLQQDGYATDPNYAGKLIGLMNQYDLYRYDLPSSTTS